VTAFAGLLRQHGANLSAVPITHTPGNGYHFYFRQPAEPLGNCKGDLPKGIDVRGSGGLTVAPFCVRPDGKAYRTVADHPILIEAFHAGTIPVVPDWLCDLIRRPDPKPMGPIRITAGRCGRREQAYARKALEGNARRLAGMAPETGRNNTLNLLTFRLAGFAARGWLDRGDIERRMFDAATACGLVRDTGRKAVTDTLKSAINAGLKHPAADLKDRS
jgi:hypothetical protein